MLLGKLMGLLTNVTFLRGDSLLAYLLGSTLGLLIMKTSGKAKLLQRFTKYSALAGFTSILLAGAIYFCYDSVLKGGYFSFLFFAVLVFRFAFWFLARITRVDIASGVGRNLAWTEFSYYLGAIVGLIAWPSWISVLQLLVIDVGVQIVATLLDNYSFKELNINSSNNHSQASSPKLSTNIFIGYCGFVVCLTVATQIVEFGFATFSVDFFDHGGKFGSWIIAAGYIGAAIGAWYLGKVPIDYKSDKKLFGLGSVIFPKFSIPIFWFCLMCFTCMSLAFITAFVPTLTFLILSLTMFAMASLIYDMLVLVLLDDLGKAAKKVGDVGAIADVYAYMGAIGSLCMFAFVHLLQQKYAFIIASFLFFTIGYILFSLNTSNRSKPNRVVH